MKTLRKISKPLLLLVIICPCLAFAQVNDEYKNIIASVDKQRINTTLSALCSSGSRVVGYPGNEAAARYIENEFRSMGLQDVYSEEFPVVVPIDKGAEIFLSADGQSFPLYCFWPNFVRTPTTPPEGLSGNLVYVEQGRWSDFNDQEIEGSIVLMDFESGTNFLNARLLGAKAVIFLASENILRAEAERKFLRTPVNIPRFWISRDDGDFLLALLESRESLSVQLKARMEWEKVVTRNIFGYIKGSDPKHKDETIVIEAYYDAMSVVPALATGADQASGIAVLLETARALSATRPRRSIMFLACSGHFMALSGVDDFVQRHARIKDCFRQRIKEPIDVHLFIGLDLSSHNSQLGVFYTGAFYNPTLTLTLSSEYYKLRYFVPFGRKIDEYAKSFAQLGTENADEVFVNTISPKKGRSWRNYFSATMFAFDAEIVSYCGNPGLALVTLNDVRTDWDSPVDVVERVDFENLTKQARFLAYLFACAGSDPEFQPRGSFELRDVGTSLSGRLLEFIPQKGFMPKDPIKNAIAVIRSPMKTYVGVRGDNFAITDENGEFCMTTMRAGNPGLEGYVLDPGTGEVIYAPDWGWEYDFPLKVPLTWDENRITIVLFRSKPVDVFELVDPRYLNVLDREAMLGAGGFPLTSCWTSILQKQSGEPNNVEPCGTLFVEPEMSFKAMFFTSLFGKRFLLLNSTPENPEGIGYTPEDGAILHTSLRVAHDMSILDGARLRNFRKYGIRNQRVEELHESASKVLQEAEKAKEERKYDTYIAKTRESWGLEARAYPDVQGTANDTIKGVVFYLALLLPFSYFAERLLFGFVDIKKRLTAVSLIFITIFLLLRFVHPAFDISSSPYIILIAFVTSVLAIYVLTMLISKFNEQMRRLRSKTTAIHGVDVGRMAASATAFALGVSFMKKRRMRTFLTTLTLVLLTFIVLSFTSVNTYLKFYQLPYKNKPNYQGALLRDPNWMPLQETVLEYVESAFGDQAIVNPRAWFISRFWGERDYFEISSSAGKYSYTTGILGLTPQEPSVTNLDKFLLPAGRWFQPGEKYSCILPAYMAHLLGIQPQDVGEASINIFGDSFRVVGILDSEGFSQFRDLDNESLAPVDYAIMAQTLLGRQTTATDVASFQRKSVKATIPAYNHLEADGVLILPYDYVRGINGAIYSIALKFHQSDFRAHIEKFITRVTRVMFVGIGDRVVAYSAASQTSLAGLGNLFIPILIVALIMLNTMVGAVYERVREIGIYSSVGLAPVHISFLFLAEACVYAILGGIMGYVLGQAVSKLVTTFDFLPGLTLNYSSMTVVFSTLLVMATVLLSTIYPARKAAQMAVPDVTRRWTFPEPEGDLLDFDFPFAVSGREVLGLYVFLLDYFSGFEEESVGNFYTRGIDLAQIDTEQGKGYRIFMKIWLAPFDLGVSQEVELQAIPAGEYDVYMIHLKLQLISGDMASWKRINRQFLKNIRKQFLIWRTIPITEKDNYAQRGKTMLKIEA